MKRLPTLALAVVAAATFLPPATAALADAPAAPKPQAGFDTEGPGDDLGVQLVDMLATVADTLSLYQDQTANEAYLGSPATTRRLRTAIFRAPDSTLRGGGARPFVEGWFLHDDD